MVNSGGNETWGSRVVLGSYGTSYLLWKILRNSLKKVIIAENDQKGQSTTKIFGNWLNPKFTVFELKKTKKNCFWLKKRCNTIKTLTIVILMKKITSYVAKLL